jgi:plastocyanin
VTALIVACGTERREPARRHEVAIEAFRFEPASIDARPGDTIVWTNRDLVPHTVTAADSAWDSGSIVPGATWSLVVGGADRAAYFCEFHPPMKGELATP